MYKPLKITAYLQSGVISDAALPLDGVLLYQACRAKWGAQDATIPGGSLYRREHGNLLPLKREHYAQWYYHASFAQWPETVAEGQDYWNKRIDASLVGLLDASKQRVPIGGGRYRSYHMPVYYRHALSVSWYVMAQLDELRCLLSMITHLGKKTDQGWGRVLRWDVEPCAADWSIYGPDGRLMRPIPAATGVLMGYRPPYWDPHNQALCVSPAALTCVRADGCAGDSTPIAEVEPGAAAAQLGR